MTLAQLHAALRDLLDALPRCATCGIRGGEVVSRDRWWLCGECFRALPWPEAEPLLDMRTVIARAQAALVA